MLADRNSAGLVMDTWSGFARDTQYKRHYELRRLSSQVQGRRVCSNAPLWLYRLERKAYRKTQVVIHHRPYGVSLYSCSTLSRKMFVKQSV